MDIHRVKKFQTEQECLNLAENARKKGRDDLADAALYRAEEIRIEQAKKTGRRPDINYHFIGLNNGDKLIIEDIGVEAEVYSERTLLYKGREVYLTPLREELIKMGYPSDAIKSKWIVAKNGTNLKDLYEAVYGPKINV